jgi:hypothetical protein
MPAWWAGVPVGMVSPCLFWGILASAVVVGKVVVVWLGLGLRAVGEGAADALAALGGGQHQHARHGPPGLEVVGLGPVRQDAGDRAGNLAFPRGDADLGR